MSEKQDPEVHAITTLIAVLEPLAGEARLNVINYVFKRLGIQLPSANTSDSLLKQSRTPLLNVPGTEPPAAPERTLAPGLQMDIPGLVAQKEPKSANEMAALVAYYLDHVAPEGELRDYIQASDISQYFPPHYPLPKRTDQALVNAKHAGYLTSIGSGRYRLNSVGHNLLVHKMGADASRGTGRGGGGKRKKTSNGRRTRKKR